MDRSFQRLLLESNRLHDLGDPQGARALEEEALASGSEQVVNTLGYCYLFQHKDVERAVTLFQKNVEDYPASWNAHDSLGEALALQGKLEEAVAAFSIAREMAPEAHARRILRTMDQLASLN